MKRTAIFAIVMGLTLLCLQQAAHARPRPAVQAPAPAAGKSAAEEARERRAAMKKKDREKLYGLTWCEKHPRQCRKSRPGSTKRWCKAHPEECAQRRAHHQTWCQKHPKRCRERGEQRRAWCKAHPDKCIERRLQNPQFDIEAEEITETQIME